jgi:hypothetical protein
MSEDCPHNSLPQRVYSPCETSCPKCGSVVVHRVYRNKGDKYSPSGIERGNHRKTAYLKEAWLEGICLKECIAHSCSICQYKWETEPLTKETAE